MHLCVPSQTFQFLFETYWVYPKSQLLQKKSNYVFSETFHPDYELFNPIFTIISFETRSPKHSVALLSRPL